MDDDVEVVRRALMMRDAGYGEPEHIWEQVGGLLKERDRVTAEIAGLRAELARSEDWIRLLEKTHKTNNRLADERRSAAARQGAEEKARLRKALKPFAEIALERDSDLTGDDRISGPDLAITPRHVREARAALACRPQGEKS